MLSRLSHYSLWLMLVLFILALALVPRHVSESLAFDRSAITSGEWWRLVSAHFVHLSLNHAVGNLFGLGLVAYIVQRSVSALPLACWLLWCCAGVSMGLWWFAEDLQRYVGFSGVLHGLLLLAIFFSNHYSRRFAWLFGAVIVAKVLWEQTPLYDDMAMFDLIGGRVEARAHLWGAMAGGVGVLVAGLRKMSVRSGTPEHE